jgi:hypothetical protein
VKPQCVLLLFVAAQCVYAATPEPYWDNPHQRFYALGGKEAAAEVIVRGNDLTTTDIAQRRDLSKYIDGGSFNAGMNEQKNPSKVRRFIWDCWRHKRRGYIRESGQSVDASGTWHIFIEPAANGKWHIAWRGVHGNKTVTDQPDIVSVAWKPRKRDDRPGSRVLVFRNRNGYEIQRM